MAITLRTRGDSTGTAERVLGRVVHAHIIDPAARRDRILVADTLMSELSPADYEGYSAVITQSALKSGIAEQLTIPVISAQSIDHLKDGHLVIVEPRTGFVLTMFRPESRHNVIFTTERCNSNCLMCSQPPKDTNDDFRVLEYLRLISLIEEQPKFLCITGGEPTLLGDGLLMILEALKKKCPDTSVQMLTNGRSFSDPSIAEALARIGHEHLICAIPLYADVAGVHDYIVQAQGAFDQTVEGIYNAARAGLRIEIRVVLHKQSIPRLQQLVEFIYRTFPFTSHVALMGLENMGYVKKNWDTLWIDPVEYAEKLEEAVRFLWLRRMTVSIYNLQLCLLPKTLWYFARRSISDYKNIYIEECNECAQRDNCAGLFLSQMNRHSEHIRAIR